MIKDESERGGDRPGAGAAPVPKPRTPRTKAGLPNSPDIFKRAARRLTQRIGRKPVRAEIKGRSFNRVHGLQAFAAAAKQILGHELQAARDASSVDRSGASAIGTSSSPAQARDHAGSAGTEDKGSGGVPDVSAELRSEMASLLAFYAARIGAVRRSLSPAVANALILVIVNEQAAALRALADRWHAASQKPERPTGRGQRTGDDLKPS